MEQSPSRAANNHSDSQQSPQLLRNPKVHYRVHKGLPLIPNMTKMNPVTSPPHFLKSHSNIILPFTPRSSKWILPFNFFNQNTVCIFNFSHACYMSRPSYNCRTCISLICKKTASSASSANLSFYVLFKTDLAASVYHRF